MVYNQLDYDFSQWGQPFYDKPTGWSRTGILLWIAVGFMVVFYLNETHYFFIPCHLNHAGTTWIYTGSSRDVLKCEICMSCMGGGHTPGR